MAEKQIMYDGKLEKALHFAAVAHKDQVRKGTNIPYIVHPIKVREILAEMGENEEVQCAGLLHDTVEDTDTTLEDLRREFGQGVADLVGEHTEDKSIPWEERKAGALRELAAAHRDVQVMVLADKIANAQDILHDKMVLGDDVFARFNHPSLVEWFYRESVQALAGLAKDERAGTYFKKFKDLVEEIFKIPEEFEVEHELTFSRRWTICAMAVDKCSLAEFEPPLNSEERRTFWYDYEKARYYEKMGWNPQELKLQFKESWFD